MDIRHTPTHSPLTLRVSGVTENSAFPTRLRLSPTLSLRADSLTLTLTTPPPQPMAHRRLFEKRFANQKKVVTLSARNRFALHGVRLKGNAVRIGDSTRCCDSRRTWATISHCKPSERLREGSPTGRDKSEDLPVSEKLHIDAFGS